MRRTVALALLAGLLTAGPALAQTAIELKKELLPKIKKAQAEGKDLGEAQDVLQRGRQAPEGRHAGRGDRGVQEGPGRHAEELTRRRRAQRHLRRRHRSPGVRYVVLALTF